jgi:hypothetical protein
MGQQMIHAAVLHLPQVVGLDGVGRPAFVP